jgi:hypothetical protein
VQGEIIDLLVVVNVVNVHLESLLLLKKVVDRDFGDKVRIKRIVNGFRLSDLDPNVPLRFEEDEHGIRKTECIRVWKILAAERQRKFLGGPTTSEV